MTIRDMSRFSMASASRIGTATSNTWHVNWGGIVDDPTEGKTTLANSYISFHGFEAKDMDLKFEIRVELRRGQRNPVSKPGWITLDRDSPPKARTDPRLAVDGVTGPAGHFWFRVTPRTSDWTGQFYSGTPSATQPGGDKSSSHLQEATQNC